MDQEPQGQPEGAAGKGTTGKVAKPTIDRQTLEAFLTDLRQKQSLLLGLLGGTAAALASAAIWVGITWAYIRWAGITAASDDQMTWMAVIVGFLVGFAVRHAGRGIDLPFGIVGAVLTLAGCFLGNLFTNYYLESATRDIPMAEVSFEEALENMKVSLEAFDLLFYAIALWVGYRLSFRPTTEKDLARLAQRQGGSG